MKIESFLSFILCSGFVCSAFLSNVASAEHVASLPPLPDSPDGTVKSELIASSTSSESIPESRNLIKQGKMQIQADNPDTGETINIDISSEELTFDPDTNEYTVSGDVYIIVPEKNMEILADKVIFNSNASNMVAFGNVFVITDQKVIGSKEIQFDFKNDLSFYKNPRTLTDEFRLEASDAERSNSYTIINQGRFILDEKALNKISSYYPNRRLRLGSGSIYSYFSSQRSRYLLKGDLGGLVSDSDILNDYQEDLLSEKDNYELKQYKVIDKPVSPRDVASADFSPLKSQYHLKVKTINIYRKPKGFDEIVFKHANFKYKNIPLAYIPFVEFGFQEDTRFINYLGPDVGYNVDYGGLYAGPGWDFRFLDGWVRYSPIITYGGGNRLRTHAGEPTYIDPQFGVGFLGNFRSPRNHTMFAYSSTLRDPIFMLEQKLFGASNTRLRVGINQIYNNGFFGSERPRFISELTDYRQFRVADSFRLRTFVTAGAAKDDFFPDHQREYFVKPTSVEPITTSRLQLQAQLKTTKPLLYLGDIAALGALTQGKLSLYGTGDLYGVFQGGPFVNIIAGPVFSQVRYLYSHTTGSTPFVFDSYYQGQNNLQTINSIDFGKYLTVGALHGLSLNQDNARNDLLVDQKFFFSVGSKTVRFSLAYDTIRKRSLFGITLNPEGGEVMLDFDTLNIYEPGYKSQPSVIAPHTSRKNSKPQNSQKKSYGLTSLNQDNLDNLE